MLITNEIGRKSFRDVFESNLDISDNIKIATGYIGASEIIRYEEKLCEISKNGGIVQIIHGMGGVEGLREKLYKNLTKLDNNLMKSNINNRVFIHRTHYHGKMYITGNSDISNVFLGSSNFSMYGFGRNIELNHCYNDANSFKHASEFFDRLKNNSHSIDKIKLPDRNKQKLKTRKFHNFDKSVFSNPPDQRVKIKVTNASNLNLFLSKGRLDRSNNIYTPRPFFEVEITIGSDDLPGIRRYLRNQKDPEEFDAVTDLGTTFKVKFKRKTSRKNDTRTLHSTGIDFMSSGREDGGRKQLGLYIKGKLMKLGLLNFGDPVTDDVLMEYGKNHLDMYFLDDRIIYLKF